MMSAIPSQPPFGAATQDPSLLAVACPSCHAALAVETDACGWAAACPLCQTRFAVPLRPLGRSSATTSATLSPTLHEKPLHDGADQGTIREATSLQTVAVPQPPDGHGTPASDAVDERRRATARRKSSRRSRRNAIMLFGGLAILLMIAILLGRKAGR
jgi:hypothetical protein